MSEKCSKSTGDKLKSPAEAQKVLKKLMDEGFFIKVDRVPNTKNNLQPSQSRNWTDDSFYAWIYQGSQLKSILYAVGLVFVAFIFVMYPMWPSPLRAGSWYVFMALIGFLGFVLFLGVVRLILFAITSFTHSPGIWLFPNLYADCGVIESFKPLWCWHVPSVREKDE